MNHKIARYLFFYPVRFLRGESICKSISEVKRFESMIDVKEAQWVKLKKLLEDTYKCIPYYKNLWDLHKINPIGIKTAEDFAKIPLLTKEIIRKNYSDLMNPIIKKYECRSTSGSTGSPLKFVKDRYATAYMDAVMYHSYSWHGITIGDNQIRFWGMPENQKGKRVARIKDFLMNRIRLSAFVLDKETCLSFINRIEQATPDYFYGYPSMIFLFAHFLKTENITIKGLSLKAVITTGEQLFDKQRKVIEECFHTRVINEYGSTEVGVIGLECPEGNMHEISSNIYLEIIKDGIPVKDEEGDVCVTELHSKTSPFVRYKIGDRGILLSEKCKCGLPYPIFKILSGRIDDFIVTPEGKKIYDAILAYTLKKSVISFKAVQKNIKSLDIFIVPDKDYNEKLEDKYLRQFCDSISTEMEFRFHYVDEIKPERSGKLRYFRSEIK